ncbi:Uncharacterized conserved protein, DUF1499 family [Fodinibius salinus]|uniref:Uncharacterized conserved protein, DUF1499 family n=1 Tax=Fodinibius salinus TaxID=860790 RepID=A0A5D3YM37_9BACT|nr:DUF1499 domain-containing protein [Fodinibius salinus]TYP94960.1 Uncharacterized conserved protein, DUF1499 family [Fodinibius salinus]
MSIWGFSFSVLSGSRSSDFSDHGTVENPLPPCPNSPNCIRITKQFKTPIDTLFNASVQAIKKMGPEKITIAKKDYKIKTVFRVVVFRDDMILKLSKRNSSLSYIHMRSASRVGETDLGVNRRRVQRFLKNLTDHL